MGVACSDGFCVLIPVSVEDIKLMPCCGMGQPPSSTKGVESSDSWSEASLTLDSVAF